MYYLFIALPVDMLAFYLILISAQFPSCLFHYVWIWFQYTQWTQKEHTGSFDQALP